MYGVQFPISQSSSPEEDIVCCCGGIDGGGDADIFGTSYLAEEDERERARAAVIIAFPV